MRERVRVPRGARMVGRMLGCLHAFDRSSITLETNRQKGSCHVP